MNNQYGSFLAMFLTGDKDERKETMSPNKKFYVNVEFTIGSGSGMGGYLSPKLRIEPDNIDEAIEEKVLKATVEMVRETFSTARLQQVIRDSLDDGISTVEGKTDTKNYT